MRRPLLAAAALAALAAAAFFLVAARVAGARLNRVERTAATAPVSERARRLHASLRIADLHDDVLLWDRDLLSRSGSGHSDLPRLIEGNVALQVFSSVTEVPRGLNLVRNQRDGDDITLLALASRWPASTWASRLARARHLATRLQQAAAASGGMLRLARTRAELSEGLQARALAAPEARPVVAVLSTEGLQALEGRLEHLDDLFAAGYRAAGLAHFLDNEVSGSAHGVARGGLTPLGRKALRRMEELRMVVDLAHASPRAFDEVLGAATRPPWVSHGGVAALCPGPRNLDDGRLRRLAAKGGLLGIGYWEAAVCDISPGGVARSIRHAVEVAGPDRVALGSDWDGATTVAFDAAQLPELTQALLDEGLTEEQIRGVMGENAIRFLLAQLP